MTGGGVANIGLLRLVLVSMQLDSDVSNKKWN